MSDTELRLADIDTECGEILSRLPCGSYTNASIRMMLWEEVPWMIARISALERLAALDAEVMVAARDLLTVLRFQGNKRRRVIDLIDAVAARDEAER